METAGGRWECVCLVCVCVCVCSQRWAEYDLMLYTHNVAHTHTYICISQGSNLFSFSPCSGPFVLRLPNICRNIADDIYAEIRPLPLPSFISTVMPGGRYVVNLDSSLSNRACGSELVSSEGVNSWHCQERSNTCGKVWDSPAPPPDNIHKSQQSHVSSVNTETCKHLPVGWLLCLNILSALKQDKRTSLLMSSN